MVEGGSFAFLESTRARLSNVVEQGRQPNNTEIKIAQRFVEFIVWPNVLDNCERMRQHILMPMKRIMLLTHCRKFRQEEFCEPGLNKKPQPRRRVGSADDLFEFVANSLG